MAQSVLDTRTASGTKAAQSPRLVSVGRHLLPRLSPLDIIALSERRWHSLHARAQEMLEDARADSAQRVAVMTALYAQRDETATLAVRMAGTLDGAVEVIRYALAKAKIEDLAFLDEMASEDVQWAALTLVGCDRPTVEETRDPK